MPQDRNYHADRAIALPARYCAAALPFSPRTAIVTPKYKTLRASLCLLLNSVSLLFVSINFLLKQDLSPNNGAGLFHILNGCCSETGISEQTLLFLETAL